MGRGVRATCANASPASILRQKHKPESDEGLTRHHDEKLRRPASPQENRRVAAWACYENRAERKQKSLPEAKLTANAKTEAQL